MAPWTVLFERDFLRLVHVVVRLLLGRLGQVADDERARVADAVLADEAHVVAADRDGRGDGHLELRLHERRLSALRRLDGLRGLRLGDSLRLDAGVVEEQLLRCAEVVAGEGDLDGGAGLSAGGADGEEARLRQAGAELLLGRGAGARQAARVARRRAAPRRPAGAGGCGRFMAVSLRRRVGPAPHGGAAAGSTFRRLPAGGARASA